MESGTPSSEHAKPLGERLCPDAPPRQPELRRSNGVKRRRLDYEHDEGSDTESLGGSIEDWLDKEAYCSSDSEYDYE